LNLLGALAIFDTIQLAVVCFSRWVYQTFKTQYSSVMCKWMKYVGAISYGCAVYIIVAMAFSRCFAVTLPMKAKLYLSVCRTRKLIVGIFIFMMVFNVPFKLYSNKKIGMKICETLTSADLFANVYPWVSLTLITILPFVILIVMNLTIIYTFSKSRRRGTLNTTVGDRLRRSMSHRNKHLTRMFLAGSIAFIVLTSPFYIREAIYKVFYSENTAWGEARRLLLNRITLMLWFTNCAANVFIYGISGTKFRKDLGLLFSRVTRRSTSQPQSHQLQVSSNQRPV
ncbi:unnamed protein product, partial [Owenia fusiformis]